MRIVVVGAGGVGGYFGGKLARAGENVTFVARGAHLAAIREGGLTVRSTIEGEWRAPVTAVENVRGLAPVDAAIVAVKSFDTESAVESLRPIVGPDTAVLTLQNGVDNEDKIDAILGPGHALGGVAYIFATIGEPGVIDHRFLGRVTLGEMDGSASARAERLRAAFEKAAVPVELSTDIKGKLWEKYLMINAQAGMTALTRFSIGVIRALPPTWAMYRALLEETAALARAEKVELPRNIVDTIAAGAQGMPPETVSSMYHDLLAGKRIELEALHGHASRLGQRHGVPTPATSAVYAALLPHVAGARR
jgi:2-dehydropantoate 2-reductase